jgi:hypothetical protein
VVVVQKLKFLNNSNKMDGTDKGESCGSDTDFKGLPVKNRVKPIKTAKDLLEEKAGEENALLADTAVLSVGMEK